MRINDDCYVITPSGKPYDLTQEDDMVVINGAGEVLSGHNKPSSELPLHLAIYNAYPAMNAIIHTHSIYASACAAMHKPIPALIEDMAQIAGRQINVADYALAGTAELGNNAVKAMGDANAVLLANHGVVSCGASLDEALIVAEIVEKSAQIHCITATLGGGVPLKAEDVQLMRTFYKEHYSKRQAGEE